MSFWVYVISNKGEIVAAADTRLTYSSNTTGDYAGSTDNVTKILNISNSHSGAAILVTGYKFWDENFEATVKQYLNENPRHSANNLIDYLRDNINFTGDCFLGIICSNSVTNQITFNNLRINYDRNTRAKSVVEMTVKSYSSPLSNTNPHRSTVSNTPEIMTIIGKTLRLEEATKDNTPFYPGPFNQPPTSNTIQGVPPQHIDTESMLRGLNPSNSST